MTYNTKMLPLQINTLLFCFTLGLLLLFGGLYRIKIRPEPPTTSHSQHFKMAIGLGFFCLVLMSGLMYYELCDVAGHFLFAKPHIAVERIPLDTRKVSHVSTSWHYRYVDVLPAWFSAFTVIAMDTLGFGLGFCGAAFAQLTSDKR